VSPPPLNLVSTTCVDRSAVLTVGFFYVETNIFACPYDGQGSIRLPQGRLSLYVRGDSTDSGSILSCYVVHPSIVSRQALRVKGLNIKNSLSLSNENTIRNHELISFAVAGLYLNLFSVGFIHASISSLAHKFCCESMLIGSFSRCNLNGFMYYLRANDESVQPAPTRFLAKANRQSKHKRCDSTTVTRRSCITKRGLRRNN
jgi:hypothetical protein